LCRCGVIGVTSEIIWLRPRARLKPLINVCVDCQGHFQTYSPHHLRCHACFGWRRASRFIQAAAYYLRRANA